EEEKRLQAEKRKKEKEVSRLEGEIAGVEAKITELQNKLSDPAVYSVGEKARAVQTEISDLQVQLEKLNEEWEQAALAL
ncbi:MAG: ABC transporter ATP-binding protein, partial [Spirochaetaceae bacterium]|nr:ABC transporter ATP-binding protein [Spirochaetaceae bacterium]